jgi:hypothetical protein
MWNLGEGKLLILMFTKNSEFIESKIIIFTKNQHKVGLLCNSTFVDFITPMNSQIKTSCLLTYLTNMCTTSNIGRMHGRLKINF